MSGSINADTCLRCGGQLEAGYLNDREVGDTNHVEWVLGKLTLNAFGKAKLGVVKRKLVDVYRCVDCGRLEMYATRSYM